MEELSAAIRTDLPPPVAASTGPRIAAEPITVTLGYDELHITGKLHRYSLSLSLTLNVPPDQGRCRVRLKWPDLVRISGMRNVREGPRTGHGRYAYRELFIDNEKRIFPGETVALMGHEAGHSIEYEFDDSIWNEITEHPMDLEYKVHLEDHQPVTGSKPFKELNIY